MNFREATRLDHDLMVDSLPMPGGSPVFSVHQAWVTDNEEGPRYWIAVRPYTFGQLRLQMWHERERGEPYPDIFSEL